MATHKVTKTRPSIYAHQRFALNNRPPNPAPWRAVANGYNYASAYLRKQVFTYGYWLQQIPNSASGTSIVLAFPFRTGENVDKLVAEIGMAPADSSAATYDPRVTLVIDNGSTTYASAPVRYRRVQSNPTPTLPQDAFWARAHITADDGLAANTQYLGYFTLQDRAKLLSASVWEEAPATADDTDVGCCNPKAFEVGAPIIADEVQDVIECGTKLWQHNRGHLLSWSARSIATRPNPTNASPGATYANISAFGTTSVSATSPGFKLFNQYMGTRSAGVPYEIGVYCVRNSGTGTLDVRLYDGTNTWAEVTGMDGTGSPYHSATTTVAAQTGATKCDLQCRVNGTADFTLWCVGVWLYES